MHQPKVLLQRQVDQPVKTPQRTISPGGATFSSRGRQPPDRSDEKYKAPEGRHCRSVFFVTEGNEENEGRQLGGMALQRLLRVLRFGDTDWNPTQTNI